MAKTRFNRAIELIGVVGALGGGSSKEFGGARHMLYCQLDLDEPHSRLRVLADRLEVPKQDLLTHRGG